MNSHDYQSWTYTKEYGICFETDFWLRQDSNSGHLMVWVSLTIWALTLWFWSCNICKNVSKNPAKNYFYHRFESCWKNIFLYFGKFPRLALKNACLCPKISFIERIWPSSKQTRILSPPFHSLSLRHPHTHTLSQPHSLSISLLSLSLSLCLTHAHTHVSSPNTNFSLYLSLTWHLFL